MSAAPPTDPGEPRDVDELKALHDILRLDPRRYLRIVEGWISQNPDNLDAYFSRHLAWTALGEWRRVLEDLDRVIAHAPDAMDYLSRGEVHRHLGDYAKALEDFSAGEALNPEDWNGGAIGPLMQADCHARLSDEGVALAFCARLPDDFWTPGLYGAPAGGKAEIAVGLKALASAACRASPDRGGAGPSAGP